MGFQVAPLVFVRLNSRTPGALTPSFLARGTLSEVAALTNMQRSSK